MSENLTPEEIVQLLDGLFSEFDEIAERRHLEKIETIGAAYMVVGGLPEPMPNAAEAIAEMALEMQDAVAGYHTSLGETLRLRIGIDIGPVVAGVIGTQSALMTCGETALTQLVGWSRTGSRARSRSHPALMSD